MAGLMWKNLGFYYQHVSLGNFNHRVKKFPFR